MRHARLAVRVRNFRDQAVFHALDVSRVEFVPTSQDHHKFNLRLYHSESEDSEEILTDGLDAPLLLSYRPRPSLLVFEE
jgi:hypothetical protein